MTLIYEVNIAVKNEIADEYATFLNRHIQEMLAIDGFQSAESFKRKIEDEGQIADERETLWTVHYRVESREKLNRYFSEKANEMRAQASERFGQRFSINRRVLEWKKSY